MHAFVRGNPLRSLVVLAGSAWRWALLAGLGLVVVALLVPSFSGLATAASGPLYDRFGAGGYWAMAAMAVAGLVAAAPLRSRLAG